MEHEFVLMDNSISCRYPDAAGKTLACGYCHIVKTDASAKTECEWRELFS